MIKRVSTYVKGLDKILHGGIPHGNVVILSGSPGTGKSILAVQFLVNGALNGEKGLLACVGEEKKDVIEQASCFGWDLEKLEEEGKLKLLFFSGKDISEFYAKMFTELKTFSPSRFVLDSLSIYAVYMTSYIFTREFLKGSERIVPQLFRTQPEIVARKISIELFKALKSTEVTAILISEMPEESAYLTRDTYSEFIADGIIILRYSKKREIFGTIEIRKMRKTSYEKGEFPFLIGKNGIEVLV